LSCKLLTNTIVYIMMMLSLRALPLCWKCL